MNTNNTCKCHLCEKTVTESEILLTNEGNDICDICAQSYETCVSCGIVIVSSDLCHDELCDNCVEYIMDKFESNKGETY